jgi:hypothetical protein
MHPDAKAILDRIETFRCRQLGACGLEIDHEGNHLGRDLVAAFGTPPARQQTGEPGHLQGTPGLVEGWPGDAEDCGDLADGNAVGLVAPHHLVAHLDQVFRIEEWVAGEQGVADGFGMGIEYAVLRQRDALWILLLCLRHAQPRYVVNLNTPLTLDCQLPYQHYIELL